MRMDHLYSASIYLFIRLTLYSTAFNGYQYGNRKLTYDFEISQGNHTLRQPTFVIFPTKDPVSDWVALAEQIKSSSFLLNHNNAVSKIRSENHRPYRSDQSNRRWKRPTGLTKNCQSSSTTFYPIGLTRYRSRAGRYQVKEI